MIPRGLWTAIALGLAACASPSPEEKAPPPSDTPTTAWTDVVAGECPVGTRPSVGNAACVAVGTKGCPAGFVADPSGWGCRDVQPASACEGATRESLGNTSCVPVGDCDAAFPPPGATMFVDASFTDAQIDATHVRTITEGVNRAGRGAIVAVAKGTYSESVKVRQPVTIAGKCARDVVLTSPNAGASAGIEAGAKDVVVRGMTLRGHRGGVVTVSDGSATVEACIAEQGVLGGLVASTGTLTVKSSRVVDTKPDKAGVGGVGILIHRGKALVVDTAIVRSVGAGVAPVFKEGSARIERSIIRDTLADEVTGGGAGVATEDGAKVEIVESVIAGARAHGLEITESCSATVTRSVIRDVTANLSGNHGHAVIVGSGGQATLEDSSFRDSIGANVTAVDAKASIAITDSVVFGTHKGPGIAASAGAAVDIENTAVVSVREFGIVAQDANSRATVKRTFVRDVLPPKDDDRAGYGAGSILGGSIEMDDSAIVSVVNVGVLGGGRSTGKLTNVLVRGTRTNTAGDFGRAIQATASAQLTVDHSILVDQEESGVVSGEDGTSVTITGTVVSGSGKKSKLGHGVVGVEGGRVAIAQSLLRENGGAALAFSGATARISDVLVTKNTVGIFVRNAGLREVDAFPEEEAVGEVLVHHGTFVDNTTRLSADELPLPEIPKLGAK